MRSDLVHRRVSPISVCLGEGRLTQSTADLQPEKRELARAPTAGVPSARTEVHPQLQLSRAPSRGTATRVLPVPALMLLLRKAVAKRTKAAPFAKSPGTRVARPSGVRYSKAPRVTTDAHTKSCCSSNGRSRGNGRAKQVLDPPAWAGRQQMHAHGNHATLAIFPKYRPELCS